MADPQPGRKLEKYLHTRALTSPWQLDNCSRTDFGAAIVIPALAEAESLPETLNSLGNNPPELLARTLIVVVVNHQLSASPAQKADNRKTLAWLKSRPLPQLNLAWVDACSDGRELPDKDGVGLARKLGFDLALSRLDWSGAALLISLDADSLVAPNYLHAIFEHFHLNPCAGAYLPFQHQQAETPAQEAVIRNYELYLRSYQFGLTWAGSPYAFIAIGSALACRAQAYVAVGGMKRRLAGEDFYFLQQLVKTGGVAALNGTLVRPAARYSARVPFGTGRALEAEVEAGQRLYQFVSCAAFGVLKHWLELVGREQRTDAANILTQATELSPGLGQFLKEADFPDIWHKLQQNAGRASVLPGFHSWFDGLRTRRLLTRLGADMSGQPQESLVAELLTAGGYPGVQVSAEQLKLLEQLQGVPSREPKEKTK